MNEDTDKNNIQVEPKKTLTEDPYIRAYNRIADHRYISLMEEVFVTENLSWWMRFGTLLLQVVAIGLLVAILFVLAGCAARREVQYIPVEKKVTKTVTVRDTLVQVVLQPYKDSVSLYPEAGIDTTSYLENPYAYSYASYSGGKLSHSLGTKPGTKAEGNTKIREEVRTDTIPYPVPVPGETVYVNKLHGWQRWLLWWGVGAHVLALIVIGRWFSREKQ